MKRSYTTSSPLAAVLPTRYR